MLLLVQEAAAATGAVPAGGGPDLRTEAEQMLKDLGIPDTGRGISDTGRGISDTGRGSLTQVGTSLTQVGASLTQVGGGL